MAQEEKLREQDRENLRAAIASGDVLADTSAAAMPPPPPGRFSADDDGGARTTRRTNRGGRPRSHRPLDEPLERVCEQLHGKLVVAEKQVDQLRDQVQMERGKYTGLLARMESAGGERGSRPPP